MFGLPFGNALGGKGLSGIGMGGAGGMIHTFKRRGAKQRGQIRPPEGRASGMGRIKADMAHKAAIGREG